MNIRVAFAAAAAVGVILYLDSRRGVRGSLGAFVVKDCKCYRVDYLTDGTTKSTLVPLEQCLETNSAELAGCPGIGAGTSSIGSSTDIIAGGGWFDDAMDTLRSVYDAAAAQVPSFTSIGPKTTDGGV